MSARVFHVFCLMGATNSGRYISTSVASCTCKMYVGLCRTTGIDSIEMYNTVYAYEIYMLHA